MLNLMCDIKLSLNNNRRDFPSKIRELFALIISGVPDDPLMQIETTFTKSIVDLADKVQQNIGRSSAFTDVIESEFFELFKNISNKRWTASRKEEMWMAFNQKRGKNIIKKVWAMFLNDGVERQLQEEEVFLLQHVLENVHEKLFQEFLNINMPKKTGEMPSKREPVTEEEEFCDDRI